MTRSRPETRLALYVGEGPERAVAAADAVEAAHDRLRVEAVSNTSDALARLGDDDVDCIVSKLDVPDGDGIEFLESVRETAPDLPFVLVTDDGNERVASDAVSAGVTEYVPTHEGTVEVDALATRVVDSADQYRTPGPDEPDGHPETHVLRAVSDVVWERCLETGTVRAADGLATATGYDVALEDLSFEWWLERVHPADRDRVRAGIEALLDDRATYAEEYRFRHADGSYLVLADDGYVASDERGEPRRLLRSVRTVTARTEGDREPASSERGSDGRRRRLEQYETVLEALPVGVVVLDDEATVEWANEEFWETLDRTEDEVAEMPFVDLIAEGLIEPEIADKYLDGVRHLLSSDNDDDRVMVEFELEPPNEDDPRQYEGYIALQPLDDGAFDGTVNAFLDVTERKERARELEQYRAAMETVPDGVFLLDENGTMTRVNEAWASTVGYDPAELNGESFLKLVEEGVVDRDSIEAYLDVLPRLLSSETGTDRAKFTTRVTPPGATDERVFEVHIGLLPFDEEFQGTAGVVRDVTEKLERQRQLERENERLEEFASIVSHDLRNPLTIAKGFTEKARETGDVDVLDRALTALDRMETITGDVLELARQGRTITETETVHVPTLFENCWGTVDTKEAERRVDGADDVWILADPDRLQQLFENLFRNAVEHGGEDVTVRVGPLESGFYLEDDGPGIPEDERDEVFEAGYSTAADGTGFGLNIVGRIVEAHGWQIAATAGEDGGARFEITDVEFTGDRE